MTENICAQAHFTKKFNCKELEDAKKMLLEHQATFVSNTVEGHHLRITELKKFKEKHNISNNATFEEIAIKADLEDDIDIHNALKIEQLSTMS